MTTKEILRDEWAMFFDNFSQRHAGWLVAVEILDESFGNQLEARALPLEGIVAELKKEGEDQIEIIVGGKNDSHVTHTVAAPTRVWLKRNGQGVDEAIEIESKGRAAIVRFLSATRPEFPGSEMLIRKKGEHP